MTGNLIENYKPVNYFPALTGIRAIAAFMVFFHHFNPVSKNILSGELYNFIKEFHIGVTIFFVLSGFLIAFRYMDDEKLNFRKYMINRFARIYPMYFLLTTFTFLVFYFFQQKNSAQDLSIYFLNITFLKGFFAELKFSGIAQGWSLTVEELFYISAPLFFIAIRKNKFSLILLPLLIIGLGLLIVSFAGDIGNQGFFRTNNFMFTYTFFGRCCEFFIGIGLSIFYKKYKDRLNTKWTTYSGIVIIIICILEMSLQKKGYKEGVPPIGILINNVILPFFGIALLFWGLLTEKTIIQKLLSTKLFVLLGKSSYVFYLIHLGVIQLFITNRISGNIYILFILINILSILLFKMLEEPINLYLRKKLN